MITGQLRQRVDQLWEEFWTGGITNPLTVIEQISFLMFSRMLDIRESLNERKAERLKGKTNFKMFLRSPDQQHLRWWQLQAQAWPAENAQASSAKRSSRISARWATPARNRFSEYMATPMLIQKPSLLVSAVNMIDGCRSTEGDTKGDLYEYLLSKLTTAGINGQFRTPRHIIRMMVEHVAPRPD